MLSALLDGFAFLGLGTPWKRFLFAGMAGFGTQFIVKPSISYNKNGSAKALGETLFPWYAWAIVPGIIAALFL